MRVGGSRNAAFDGGCWKGITAGLRVEVKDLFNFDRTAYRKLEPLSREVRDIASRLQRLPVERQRQVIKVLKIFTE